MFDVSIPKTSNEELMKRYQQIKPVITVDGKLHHFREFTFEEIVGINYLWYDHQNVRQEVNEGELEAMEDKDFVCLHNYAFPGIVKPSIAEVLSQIDVNDLPSVKAFEITKLLDFCENSFTYILYQNGYYTSIIKLYK